MMTDADQASPKNSARFKVREAARQYQAFTLRAIIEDTMLSERSIDPVLRRMIHDQDLSVKQENGAVVYFWLEGRRERAGRE